LSDAVAARNLGDFEDVLAKAATAFGKKPEDVRFLSDVIWQDVQRIDSSYGVVFEQIALQSTAAAKPAPTPPQQTVIADDDGTQTVAELWGTSVLGDVTEDAKKKALTYISPSLLVQPTGQAKPDIYLPLSSSSVAANKLTFHFPSMRDLRLMKVIQAGAAVSLQLNGVTPPDPAEPDAKPSKWTQTFPVRFKPRAEDEEKSVFTLARSADVVISDPTTGKGEARVTLTVKGKARIKLSVLGADWDDQAGDGSLFTQSQTVSLRLSNLVEATPVKVTAIVLDADGAAIDTQTIQFTVKNAQKVAAQ
jgi:hypothetical protein